MSQFAREHPEDWEDRIEQMRDQGDQLRKERREQQDLNGAAVVGCTCVEKGYKGCPLTGNAIEDCHLGRRSQG